MSVKPATLFRSFKVVLTTQGPLEFHMNFRINLSGSSKKSAGHLIETALNL